MTLANLTALADKATPAAGILASYEAREALGAAAPAMAELLIACEQALDIAHGILDEEGYFVDPDFPHAQKIDHVLARLADFDGRIG